MKNQTKFYKNSNKNIDEPKKPNYAYESIRQAFNFSQKLLMEGAALTSSGSVFHNNLEPKCCTV